MMKIKTYPLILLASVALAACQDDLSPTNNGDTTGHIPVTLRMELAGATATAGTRAASTRTFVDEITKDIAATPAEGEITAGTAFGIGSYNTLTLLLPSANKTEYRTLLYAGTIGTNTGSGSSTTNPWKYTTDGTNWQGLTDGLYLKDFTSSLNPAAVAYATRTENGATDYVFAIAPKYDLIDNAQTATYNLKLKHATAKISIYLQNAAGKEFDKTAVKEVKLEGVPTGTYSWKDDTGTSFTDNAAIISWMNTEGNRDKQPTYVFTAGSTGTYTLTSKSTTSIDTGSSTGSGSDTTISFWNTLIPPMTTVSEASKVTVTLNAGTDTAGNPLPTGTYSIALSDITVDNGTLTAVTGNQHLLLTLTLDRQTGLNGTATIGDWNLKTIEVEDGDDDTSGAMKP